MGSPVNMTDSGGNVVTVDDSDIAGAIAAGLRPETIEGRVGRVATDIRDEQYGGVSGKIGAAGAGLLRGATLGGSDLVLDALGAGDTLQNLKEANPITSIGAEVLGGVAPAFIPGGQFTPAGALSKVGRSIAETGAGAGILGKAASSVAGGAFEGGVQAGGSYLSSVALENKPLSAEAFVGAMGKGMLFGGAIGGAFGIGERTLQRAKSLFPKSEVTKEAAETVEREAQSAIKTAVDDGETMQLTARQQIEKMKLETAQADQVFRSKLNEIELQKAQVQLERQQALADRAKAGPSKKPRKVFDGPTDEVPAGDVPPVEALPPVDTPPPVEPPLIGDTPPMPQVAAPGPAAADDLAPQTPDTPSFPDRDAIDQHMMNTDSYFEQPMPASAIAERGYYEPIATTHPPAGQVIVAVSPEGKLVVTGGRDTLSKAIQSNEQVPIKWDTGDEPALDDFFRGATTKRVPIIDTAPPPPPAVESVDDLTFAGKIPEAYGDRLPEHIQEWIDKNPDYVRWQNATKKRLTPEQHESVLTYTDSFAFEPINKGLRGGKTLEPDLQRVVGDLDAAMAGLPEDMTLVRSVNVGPGVKHYSDYKVGDVFSDPAFLSTSASPTYGGKDKVVITIKAPKGTPGIPAFAGVDTATETEVLLGRGLTYRVSKHETVPVGTRKQVKLELEVVPSGAPSNVDDAVQAALKPHATPDLDADPFGTPPPPRKPRAPKVQKTFAEEVADATDRAQKFGQHKAFISSVYDNMPSSTRGSFEEFRNKLLAANKEAELSLSRADLVAAMDKKLVSDSLVSDGGAEFHFVNISPKRVAANEAAAEATSKAAALMTPTSLEGQLHATKAALDAGRTLPDLSHQADEALVAARPEAARIVDAARKERMTRLEIQDWIAGRRAAGDINAAERGYRVGYETSLAGGKTAAGVGSKLDRVTTYGPETELSKAKRIRTESKVAPEERLRASAAADRVAGRAPSIGAEVLDSASPATLDDQIAATLRSKPGQHVDIGDDLAEAARKIGAHEEASAELAEALGDAAPSTAAERAKALRDATASHADSAAMAGAAAADGLATKLAPEVARKTGKAIDRATIDRLGDVGAGLEVLRAMGVQVPDVEKIPVIGPVLSMYLKARAAMGVFRRAGGSLPRTAESVIASKATTTRDRMTSAVHALLDTSSRAVGKASALTGPAAGLAYKLFPGQDDKRGKDKAGSDVDLYRRRMDELTRAAQPGAILQAIRERIPTSDPVLQQEIVAAVERKVAFLNAKAPRQSMLPTLLKGDGEWRPSRPQLAQFSRYMQAAEDPASVLEDVARGRAVSIEAAETLRKVYPTLYREAQMTLIQRAQDMQEKLPYSRRVALSILFEVPVDGTMSPSHIQFLQQGAPAAAPMPAQGSPVPGAPPQPTISGPVALGDRTMTSLDRRAGA